MDWKEQVNKLKNIEANKSYKIRLSGYRKPKKAIVMYVLNGYYTGENEKLIVFRTWCRNHWLQEVLTEDSFKFCIVNAKK
jgi:hypothetical protein